MVSGWIQPVDANAVAFLLLSFVVASFLLVLLNENRDSVLNNTFTITEMERSTKSSRFIGIR